MAPRRAFDPSARGWFAILLTDKDQANIRALRLAPLFCVVFYVPARAVVVSVLSSPAERALLLRTGAYLPSTPLSLMEDLIELIRVESYSLHVSIQLRKRALPRPLLRHRHPLDPARSLALLVRLYDAC